MKIAACKKCKVSWWVVGPFSEHAKHKIVVSSTKRRMLPFPDEIKKLKWKSW